MEQERVNPWEWQSEMGYSQAIEVRQSDRVLYCAGQTSMDSEGNPVYPGDIRAQINKYFDNINQVLTNADFKLADVVQIDCYTTDVNGLFEHWDLITDRLEQPTCTLLGVERLAFPELLVEIKPTAMR
ncbi:enamine deaminase RidA (plasmid) [Salinigranum rubrum]|uniref:Enamine deaminase RidA n=1 Tax=Salinigranum rubrum TaxID=755307 RepID=A0A2I8VQ87_9EURY|nr:RidA family protein [Salinigranum rubrum]AUV84092.1 enamine deaminase RidA [Salinigranum rubrum]